MEFISTEEDGVIQMVTLDEFCEVSLHTVRKKLLSQKSNIELLPLVFENVFMIKLTTVQLTTAGNEKKSATILAVSSQ
jgi:hypothetical protein